MNEPTLEILVRRVERLERQNRHLRFAGLAALAAVASLLLIGAASPSRTVEAEKFVLRDEKGKERAVLHIVPTEGPALDMYDGNGMQRISLIVEEEGPGLTLSNSKGADRICLCAEDEGYGLVMFDAREEEQLWLGVSNGKPNLRLRDVKGKLLFRAPRK